MDDGRAAPRWSLVESHFAAMGTVVAASIAIDDESRRPAAAQALAEVRRLIVEFGIEGWAWGSGALGRFNRALLAGGSAEVPALLRPLFARAAEIAAASDGWFEPRIGRLVQLWGFDRPEHNREMPPCPAEVDAALAHLRSAPRYLGETHYGPAPGAAWDLGAIGKGYIAELALDWLAHRGFGDALLNAGGHVAARGRAGTRAWRIGIRDPRPSASGPELIAELAIGDESVVTHGDDQRYFEHGGRRYAHLLDPHSGRPATGIRSLTVVHADGVLADAGGAALFAAGPQRWRALAGRLGLAAVLVVTDDGEVETSAALAARIRLSGRHAIQGVS